MSIQLLSLILLAVGIGLAFSQIHLSGWLLGWILLSGALLLQGFRSMLSYVVEHGGVDATTYTAANEWMGLGFALLVVAAMHLMREVFARQKLAAESLRVFGAVANDAIIILDSNATITVWNQAAQRIFGYSEHEAKGRKLGDLIVPERGRAEFEHAFRHISGDGQDTDRIAPAELAVRRKDGQELFTEYSISRVMIEGTWHAIYIVRDISVRRQAEAALKAHEERFRVLFDRASDGILILAPSGRIVAVNEAFARMHGYSPEEMRNIGLQDLHTAKTRELIPERMKRILSGESMTFEVEHYHKDGHVISLEVSSGLIPSDGELLVQAFHRDITERNRQRDLITQHNALLTRQKAALEATLGRIKRLEGLISICMNCKKMRAGNDVWQQLEEYIGEHSDAVFSHGLCPECLAKEMTKLN